MRQRIANFGSRIATALLVLNLVACASATPTPRGTPFPTRAQPEDLAHALLAQAMSELEYDLTQARSLLTFLGKSAQIQSASSAECNAYVKQMLMTNPQYSQIAAATPNGVLYCDSTARARQVSIADRLYFSRAMSERDFAVGEYVIGRVTLTPSLGLAYPLLDDTRALRGVVIAPLRLSWLAQRFADFELPVTGEIVILDTYGNLLLRDPDATEWYGKNISETPIGKTMLAKIKGSGEFAGADGVTRFYAFGSPSSSQNRILIGVGIQK